MNIFHSPVVVLLGEDDNNQTAVVVLSDDEAVKGSQDDFNISAILGSNIF